jgi:alkylation response protein AidB-like acyl-CoA dehydrogenase
MNDMTSPSGHDYLSRARSLAATIERAADETERSQQLSPEAVNALTDGGFYRMLQPRFLGGGELPLADFMAVIEELAKSDASSAWCVSQCGTCAMAAAYLDRETAREVFGPPDGIVAWGPPGPSEARVVDGGYRVTGKWNFASGSYQAKWLGGQCYVVDRDGTPTRRSNGAPAIRTMLLPRRDVQMAGAWNVMGLKGTGSDTYSVEDLFVPERFSFGRDDPTDRREEGLLITFSTSNVYSVGFAALALGIARRMLDDAKDVVTEKLPYGTKKPMRENNVIQSQIGRSEAAWRAARTYLYASAQEIWRAMAVAPTLSLDQRVEIRLSSAWAIHQAAGIADTVFHMVGSTAIFEAKPFERRFRDIHTVTQQLQGRQSHYESVGQVLLGLEPDAALFST